MDRIQTPRSERAVEFENTIVDSHAQKKRVVKNLMTNAGLILGVFLLFIAIVIATTDIRIISWEEATVFGLDFFLLLSCSYSMYISASDSGMRNGFASPLYIESLERFTNKKNEIIAAKLQTRLHEFCQHYINTELRNARTAVIAVVGFGYKEYQKKWLGLDAETIESDPLLSKTQKAAIIRANNVKPLRLTPEMFMKRGRGSKRRDPLGTSPETKKGINYTVRLFTTIFLSFWLCLVVLTGRDEPFWIVFASCMIKVLAVIINGFTGYKFGYENIVFDTVNYMDDQTDLMEQAMQYCDEHPQAEDNGEDDD